MKFVLRNKVTSAILILIGGAIYGGYSLTEFLNGQAQSMSQELNSMDRDTANLKSELSRIKKFADNIPAVKQSFREQSLQLESVLESIPRSFEFSILLKKFSLLAQNAGVEILSFRPQSGEQEQGYFKSTMIDLSLKGGFISTLVFLDQLSKLKRVVGFDEITMNAQRGSDDKSKGTVISATNVKLRAYRLGDS
ncbi:MAG: type 4a pilus biogenesis protein PilO [Pseudomonadota bacterium]